MNEGIQFLNLYHIQDECTSLTIVVKLQSLSRAKTIYWWHATEIAGQGFST